MNDSSYPEATDWSPPSQVSVSTEQDESGFNRLAPQQISLERSLGYVFALIVAAASAVGLAAFVLAAAPSRWTLAWLLPACLVLAAMLLFYVHFWPKITYRHASWRQTPVGLEIRRGVLWRHRVAIPVARVQHVDVSQGPVQRMFDLGTLTIHTAGTSHASVELTGLTHASAMQLRDQLIERKESLDVT